MQTVNTYIQDRPVNDQRGNINHIEVSQGTVVIAYVEFFMNSLT